ncbi:hypothetical protein WMY93_026027 [Mugilogobius chulae]|uniref:Uncharacterized protein n=1 Tax=Mugilogobius chulae TaxID=88201 RepID=A0AAW0N6J9_9GOBI
MAANGNKRSQENIHNSEDDFVRPQAKQNKLSRRKPLKDVNTLKWITSSKPAPKKSDPRINRVRPTFVRSPTVTSTQLNEPDNLDESVILVSEEHPTTSTTQTQGNIDPSPIENSSSGAARSSEEPTQAGVSEENRGEPSNGESREGFNTPGVDIESLLEVQTEQIHPSIFENIEDLLAHYRLINTAQPYSGLIGLQLMKNKRSRRTLSSVFVTHHHHHSAILLLWVSPQILR